MGPCWPGHYFSQFEKRLPHLEIKSMHLIHLGKSSVLNHEPSTKYNLSDFEFGSICRCLASLEKSIDEFLMVI